MTAMANSVNSTALINVITSYHLPETFVISKETDSACDGRVDLNNITNAVAGDWCLGQKLGYNDAVAAFKSSNENDMMVVPLEEDTCGCFCSCSIACMALLLLAPLCCKSSAGERLSSWPAVHSLIPSSRGWLCWLPSRLRLTRYFGAIRSCRQTNRKDLSLKDAVMFLKCLFIFSTSDRH